MKGLRMSKLFQNSYFQIYCALTVLFGWYAYEEGMSIKFSLWFFLICSIVWPLAMQIRSFSWAAIDGKRSGEHPVTHICDLCRGKKLDEQSLVTALVVLGYFILVSIALIVVNIIS